MELKFSFSKGLSGRRTRSAYSLIEVLICLFILTLVFLGIASVFPTGHAFLKHSSNIGKATAIAQSVIEQQRKLSFDMISDKSGQITTNDLFNGASSSVTYDYSVTVTPQGNDLKVITAEVTWIENIGKRNVTVASMVFGNPDPFGGSGSSGGDTGGGDDGGGDDGDDDGHGHGHGKDK